MHRQDMLPAVINLLLKTKLKAKWRATASQVILSNTALHMTRHVKLWISSDWKFGKQLALVKYLLHRNVIRQTRQLKIRRRRATSFFGYSVDDGWITNLCTTACYSMWLWAPVTDWPAWNTGGAAVLGLCGKVLVAVGLQGWLLSEDARSCPHVW